MTWPRATSKSTACRACTAPKRFDTPRSWRTGWSVTSAFLSRGRTVRCGAPRRRGAPTGTTLWRDSRLLAGLCVLAGADLGRLEEAVLDHRVVDVVLGHRHRREQDRGHLPLAVVGLAVDEARGRARALGQGNRQRGGRVGFLLDRLVDGHALVTREDVLDALGGR